jgi:hypothetical protein
MARQGPKRSRTGFTLDAILLLHLPPIFEVFFQGVQQFRNRDALLLRAYKRPAPVPLGRDLAEAVVERGLHQ